MLALQAQRQAPAQQLSAFIIPLGVGMNRHALKLARSLRRENVTVDVGEESFRIKKSFETAEKLGACFAIIVGENEVKEGRFTVKNLSTGEQSSAKEVELLDDLRSRRF